MARLARFWRSEEGALSILGVYFTVICVALTGLAADFWSRAALQEQMQIATDASAHAALLTRAGSDAATARARAVELGAHNLPPDAHGAALAEADVEFGSWNAAAQVFVPDPRATQAVRVRAVRSVARGNLLENVFLRVLGWRGFELEAETIYSRAAPPCDGNGFIAIGRVDLQSNNDFGPEFCVHSQSHIEMNNHNGFAQGAVVSMPSLADLVTPGGRLGSNPGLAEALRSASYAFDPAQMIDDAVADLEARGESVPEYVSGSAFVVLDPRRIGPEDIAPGRLHRATCRGKESLPLTAGEYAEFVLLTNCEITIAKDVGIEDAVIATSATGARSVFSPSGLRLGRPDACAPGGGVVLMTQGGFRAAARMQIFGSQIIAAGSVDFAAQADGVKGAAIYAGGEIDTTSNIRMDGCPGDGVTRLTEPTRLRMVF